jgi:ribosomal protein L11 methyltransferase
METQYHWLEISLEVDGELAEAVAEVLSRFIPSGVVVESTAVAVSGEGGQASGPLRVCGYLPMDGQVDEVRQQIEEALWYLGRIQSLPAPVFTQLENADWSEAWKKNFRPLEIGQRLLISPSWITPVKGDRQIIYIDPGMAFGTGTHPTTQLCLQLVEEFVKPGKYVIDLGCGSGILALAALKLGAGHALGVDTDPDALRVAAENARRNGLAARLTLREGSLDSILQQKAGLRQAPLVLVNILAPVIIRLLGGELGSLLAPGGHLVLSGILEEQVDSVVAAMHSNGISLIKQEQKGDWAALVGQYSPSRQF